MQGAGAAGAVCDPGSPHPGGGEPAALRLLALPQPRQGAQPAAHLVEKFIFLPDIEPF